MNSPLASNWRHAHTLLQLPPDMVEFNRIINSYGQFGRFYHTPRHLIYGLKVIEGFYFTDSEFETRPEDIALAKLVFFFHDDYDRYDGQPSNEQQSADRFVKYCHKVDIPNSFSDRGYELILATADHQGTDCADYVWPIINDADLAIMAADPETYQKYSNNVWREYEHVGRPAFVLGRLNFLQKFLTKPIFRSQLKRYEDIAIKNILDEIKKLSEEAQTLGLTAAKI